MATYTADYVANRFATYGGKITLLERIVDFAEIASYRASAGLTALASGDVYELFSLPAKTNVLRVGYDVTTAEGATATMGVGDGSAATGYLTAVNLNSVASGVMALALTDASPGVTVTGYTNGKYYSAADTIDLTLNHSSIDTAVVRVWIVIQDCA